MGFEGRPAPRLQFQTPKIDRALPSSRKGCGPKVPTGQAQHQHHRVGGRSLEATVRVELPCLVMQCMHQQGRHTGVLRDYQRALHGILQQ